MTISDILWDLMEIRGDRKVLLQGGLKINECGIQGNPHGIFVSNTPKGSDFEPIETVGQLKDTLITFLLFGLKFSTEIYVDSKELQDITITPFEAIYLEY